MDYHQDDRVDPAQRCGKDEKKSTTSEAVDKSNIISHGFPEGAAKQYRVLFCSPMIDGVWLYCDSLYDSKHRLLSPRLQPSLLDDNHPFPLTTFGVKDCDITQGSKVAPGG